MVKFGPLCNIHMAGHVFSCAHSRSKCCSVRHKRSKKDARLANTTNRENTCWLILWMKKIPPTKPDIRLNKTQTQAPERPGKYGSNSAQTLSEISCLRSAAIDFALITEKRQLYNFKYFVTTLSRYSPKCSKLAEISSSSMRKASHKGTAVSGDKQT